MAFDANRVDVAEILRKNLDVSGVLTVKKMAQALECSMDDLV